MSDKHEDGGPAFPVEERNPDGSPAWLSPGMTLRDYFAARAMHGLLVNTVKVNDNKPPFPESVELARSYADASYLFADAMIEARKS